MNHQQQRCACTYRNPIQYVCLYPSCKNKRVICQSCAWNHRTHEKNVKEIHQWEEELNNDCVIQRINNIRSNQTHIHNIAIFSQAVSQEITKVIHAKCAKLSSQMQVEDQALVKVTQAIKNISSQFYDNESIELLVKEFEPLGIHEQLDKYELSQYSRFKPVYGELFHLIDSINGLYTICETKHSNELVKLKKSIDDSFKKHEQIKKTLDFHPVPSVQKISFFQTLENQQKQPVYQKQKEEQKDNNLNDFINSLKNYQSNKQEAVNRNLNLSFSQLNLQKKEEQPLRSERQSFYLASQRPEILQPMSSKSNPYQNSFQLISPQSN